MKTIDWRVMTGFLSSWVSQQTPISLFDWCLLILSRRFHLFRINIQCEFARIDGRKSFWSFLFHRPKSNFFDQRIQLHRCDDQLVEHINLRASAWRRCTAKLCISAVAIYQTKRILFFAWWAMPTDDSVCRKQGVVHVVNTKIFIASKWRKLSTSWLFDKLNQTTIETFERLLI